MKSIVIAMLFFAMSLAAYEYTLSVGDYKIKMTEPGKHSIRSIDYKGYLLCPASGWNGSVLTPATGGTYIGAGHSEGGTELIKELSVKVDGKDEQPAANAVFTGENIVIEKVSQLDKLLVRVRLTFTKDGIVEQKKFVATDTQNVFNFYIFQYCWDKMFSHWFAITSNGQELSGEFTHEKVEWHLNSDIKWLAEYNAITQKGVFCFFPKVIPGQSRKSTIWEVPKSYNKYYLFLKLPKVLPSGYASEEFAMLIRGFEAASPYQVPAILKTENEKAEKYAVTPIKELK